LREPRKYQRVGGQLPKGVLLIGPPGTGKTMLAKAIASEAKASFFSAHGSDFTEVFVGVGAKRVRQLFRQAAKNKPAIIFIDEIDGKSNYRIIVSASAIPSEHYAAEELQRYIEKMSGAKLPIVTDAEPRTSHEIPLGD